MHAGDGERFAVPGPLSGERVDRAIALVTGCSRADAARWIAAGEVRISGVPVLQRSRRLAEGEVVEIPASRAGPPAVEPDPEVAFGVVYEDEHLAIVDKPAGLVVHPGAGSSGGTLCAGLLARWPGIADVGEASRPGIVHRLDKGTSGVLVVARSQRAYTALHRMIARHEVVRRYLSLVEGTLSAAAGTVDAPIGRSQADPTRMAVRKEGRAAVTHYDVQSRLTMPFPATLVEVTLETGRTHQIRVHLAAIGHPVVGDPRYGARRLAGALGRPFLHASRLSFAHPVTGERIEASAPLPDDLAGLLGEFEAASG